MNEELQITPSKINTSQCLGFKTLSLI